jgi:hypothetical protein
MVALFPTGLSAQGSIFTTVRVTAFVVVGLAWNRSLKHDSSRKNHAGMGQLKQNIVLC